MLDKVELIGPEENLSPYISEAIKGNQYKQLQLAKYYWLNSNNSPEKKKEAIKYLLLCYGTNQQGLTEQENIKTAKSALDSILKPSLLNLFSNKDNYLRDLIEKAIESPILKSIQSEIIYSILLYKDHMQKRKSILNDVLKSDLEKHNPLKEKLYKYIDQELVNSLYKKGVDLNKTLEDEVISVLALVYNKIHIIGERQPLTRCQSDPLSQTRSSKQDAMERKQRSNSLSSSAKSDGSAVKDSTPELSKSVLGDLAPGNSPATTLRVTTELAQNSPAARGQSHGNS